MRSMKGWSALLCVLLVGSAVLSGCKSREPETAEEKRQAEAALPHAEVDPEAQKLKAVQTRLQAGMEALKARDPERARRHISRALELDSDSPEANNAMALLYRFEGDEKREEEFFRKAIRSNGDYSQARNNYAALLYRKGRYDDAIDQLEKASNDPNYDQRAVAFLNLGRSYAKVGELDKANTALQRSLRLESQRPETLLELAEVLLRQQKYGDAETYLSMFQTRMRNTPRSLWVGIRLAAAQENADKLASYEFQLAKLFKDSPEYAEWRTWKSGAAPAKDKRKSR